MKKLENFAVDLIGWFGAKMQRLFLRLKLGGRLRELDKWSYDRGDLYLRLEYPLMADDVVWDVGAFEGQWASDIFARFKCTVHAFEPVPAFSAAVRKRFAQNDRIIVHAFGLGAEDCTVTMNIAGDSSSHAVSQTGKGDAVSAEIRAFETVFRDLRIDRIALIKINIEGAEYDLIAAMIASGLIARCDHVQIQFHDFVPSFRQRRDATSVALGRTHTRTWCYPFVWESWSKRV